MGDPLIQPDQGGIRNPALGSLETSGSDGLSFFQKFIPALIGLLFVGGAIFFFFMLVWGSIQWIVSGGDKAAIEGARGRITAAFVGMVLLLSTFAIVKLVETFFGVDILTIDIGPLVIQ